MSDEKIPTHFLQAMGLLGRAAYKNKKPQLEIYEDNKEPTKKWRWKITMSSDIVAASTQGYSTRAECVENIKKIGNHIIELEKEGKL
jgi:uncharacterized protein YegP (UPF0339 family)